jgi:hypothetical protein
MRPAICAMLTVGSLIIWLASVTDSVELDPAHPHQSWPPAHALSRLLAHVIVVTPDFWSCAAISLAQRSPFE